MKGGAFPKLEVVGVGVAVTLEGAAAVMVVVGKAAEALDVRERR